MALILSLLIVFLLSAAAAAIIFATQTDVVTTANYSFLTQARYVSEAGAQAAANWVIAYTVPTNPCTSSSLTCTTYPISDASTKLKNVVLTTDPNVTQYFPIDGTAQTNFSNYIAGLPSLGVPGASFVVTAQLMSVPGSGGVSGWPETQWLITSKGTISNSSSAWKPVTVQVQETLEYQPSINTFQYGAFATATGCAALSLGGSMYTDSYNSGWVSGGGFTPVGYSSSIATNHGNIGSNGNLTITGNGLTVNGSYSSPDTGIGNCVSGTPDALTGRAALILNDPGGVPIKLASALVYPTPTIPPAGTASPSGGTINPGNYGNISVGGNSTLILDPGTTAPGTYVYNINSLDMHGSSQMQLKVTTAQVIVINVTGAGTTTPMLLRGTSNANSNTLTPEQLVINYAGTGTITLGGTSDTTALVYAPNAVVSLSGNGDVNGAVVGNTITDSGSSNIHYDTNAANVSNATIRNYLLSFSWSKY